MGEELINPNLHVKGYRIWINSGSQVKGYRIWINPNSQVKRYRIGINPYSQVKGYRIWNQRIKILEAVVALVSKALQMD